MLDDCQKEYKDYLKEAISFMDSKGVIAGQPLGSWWDSHSSCILIGCDERTSSEDISALVTVIEEWIEEVSN